VCAKPEIEIPNGLPAVGFPLPLNSQDIGTSRWQFGDEIYVGNLA
jgi:hypothetical protein